MEEEHVNTDTDGRILSIAVRNLCCFDEYEFNKLDKNINIVVGRNGSGKSTIVTAVVVGLGGRAAVKSKKGKELSEFIKAGCSEASVAVKIKNSGKTYKYEEYGDSITIVHNFDNSGSSSYQVISDSGDVKSTMYYDVKQITSAFNIHVENPICVLTQDESRDLLRDKKTLYKFFRLATNLDETERNYKEALKTCETNRGIYNDKLKGCRNLERKYYEWKEKHDLWVSLEAEELRKTELEIELIWSKVCALEREERAAKESAGQAAARCDELRAQLGRLRDTDQQRQRALEEQRAAGERAAASGAARAAARLALRDAQAHERAARLRLQQRAAAARAALLLLQNLRDQIRAIREGSREEAQRAEEERADAALGAADERVRALQAELPAEPQAGCEAQESRVADELAAARRALQKAREARQRAARARRDPLAAYGPAARPLRERLARQLGRFSQPPKGPVGTFIQLRDERWAGALEHILGPFLFTFCVNSEQDARTMINLINEVYEPGQKKPGVVVCPFLGRRHAVEQFAVRHARHASALDALLIADADVANYLIDSCALESILLVPDYETARELTEREETVPRNLHYVLTEDCEQCYPAPNYRYYPAPNYCGSAGNRPVRYLTSDHEDLFRRAGEEERRAEEALARLERDAARAGERARALARAQAERAAAERARPAPAPAPAPRALEQEASECEERAREQEARRAEAEQALQAAQRAAHSLQRELDQATQRYHQDKQCLLELREAVQQAEREDAAAERQRGEARAELAAQQQRAAELAARLRDLQQRLQAHRDDALLVCPPVHTEREPEELQGLVAEANRKLQSRAGGGSRECAAVGMRDALATYNKASDELRTLDRTIQTIATRAKEHLQLCYEAQTHLARQIDISYQCVLKHVKYEGKALVDFPGGKLECTCWAQGARGRAGMSGGEQSCALVALFMALWECILQPFCFLDEFTVFMDNNNLKVMMDLLLKRATQHANRQFGFFTPLDISHLVGPDVNVFEIQKLDQ